MIPTHPECILVVHTMVCGCVLFMHSQPGTLSHDMTSWTSGPHNDIHSSHVSVELALIDAVLSTEIVVLNSPITHKEGLLNY